MAVPGNYAVQLMRVYGGQVEQLGKVPFDLTPSMSAYPCPMCSKQKPSIKNWPTSGVGAWHFRLSGCVERAR